VTSDGIIKSGHHIAYVTGMGKKKCRNTGTDEQMAQRQQVTPISKNEENECEVTQSTRNMNKWNYSQNRPSKYVKCNFVAHSELHLYLSYY
jgi:hypothetical protein